MDKKDVLNKMIPADDLHWIPGEGFTLLSIKEVDDIVDTCGNQGMPEEDIIKTVRWCESIRSGQVLWKNVISGVIRIHHFEDDQPVFVKGKE